MIKVYRPIMMYPPGSKASNLTGKKIFSSISGRNTKINSDKEKNPIGR